MNIYLRLYTFSFGSAYMHSKELLRHSKAENDGEYIVHVFTLFFDKILICSEEGEEGCG